MFLNISFAFILSLVAIGFLVVTLYRTQTVLLGFTCLLFFSMSSASLSAFLVTILFKLDTYWITQDHLWVFIYSAYGFIAFVSGVALAWRPLLKHQIDNSRQRLPLVWLEPHLIWVAIIIGAVAYILLPYTYVIPTGRVIGSSLTWLLPFGVLFALIRGQSTSNYGLFLRCLAIYIPFILFQMMSTGHLGAGGTFLIQMLFVACFGQKFNVRGVAIFVVSIIFTASLFFGWLESRSLIRHNLLSSNSTYGRLIEFGSQFSYQNPTTLTPEYIRSNLFTRIDMSQILSAQVRHQPAHEPYANGATFTKDLLASVVPRFLWPNKPVYVGGSDRATQYSGVLFSRTTSVALPYQFELYANGGALWVVVGLFVIGWSVARLELSLFSAEFTLPQFMSFLFLTKSISTSEQFFTTMVMSAVGGAITYYLSAKLLEIYFKRHNSYSTEYGMAHNIPT